MALVAAWLTRPKLFGPHDKVVILVPTTIGIAMHLNLSGKCSKLLLYNAKKMGLCKSWDIFKQVFCPLCALAKMSLSIRAKLILHGNPGTNPLSRDHPEAEQTSEF